MADKWQGADIRYWDLAPKLFTTTGKQEMIPFLGAGVSVSDRKDGEPHIAPDYPDDAKMQEVAQLLKLDGPARLYVEYAIRTAIRMQAWEKANGGWPSREQLLERLRDCPYPPYAWELSEMFSQVAPYNSLEDRALKAIDSRDLLPKVLRQGNSEALLPMLKLLAMTTDLTGPTDPLTSISSYYEYRGERRDLWSRLFDAVAPKETPTETHRLIAEVAQSHLASNDLWNDYLIITTNYDSLMEKALDERKVPYVVLRWKRKDRCIYPRFANLPAPEIARLEEENPPVTPGQFVLNKRQRMAIVYKMHGCLHKDLVDDDDGLVVSDNDYVDFISNERDIIPSCVGSLLGPRSLLFLGYSFSDWNVRSVYETIVNRTAKKKGRDYAVPRSVSRFEEVYFGRRDIVLVLTDLAAFVKGIRSQRAAAPV